LVDPESPLLSEQQGVKQKRHPDFPTMALFLDQCSICPLFGSLQKPSIAARNLCQDRLTPRATIAAIEDLIRRLIHLVVRRLQILIDSLNGFPNDFSLVYQLHCQCQAEELAKESSLPYHEEFELDEPIRALFLKL
jgi:hypothetical protein